MGLPWHVALVPNRRALLTAAGIALAVAFTILSFSVGVALEGTTIELGEHLRQGDVAIHREGLEPFRPIDLGLDPGWTAILLVEATTQDGQSITLAALEGNTSVSVTPGRFRIASDHDDLPTTLSLREPAALSLVKEGNTGDPIPLRAWARIAPEDARRLSPDLADGRASYVLDRGLSEDDVARLGAEGFVVDPAPAADSFFTTSSREVARALLLVVLVSSILAGLFAYEFFRSELREKRREIALWRALGMRARDVLALLLARAAALGALGVAAGVIGALALLAGAAAITRVEILTPRLSPAATLGLALAFTLAAILGSLLPALGAARTEIASAMEEAA